MAGVGGWLVVSAQDPSSEQPSTSDEPGDTPVDTVTSNDSLTPGTEAPVITIGSVAPPVSVGAGDDGEIGDDGLVLDDFTPTETPQPPSSPRTVPNAAIVNGSVASSLPDGDYLGYLEGVSGSTAILVRFDSATGPEFEVPLTDLLFVSLRVDARDPSHPGSAVVSARTLSRLLDQGEATYTIPDTDDLVLIDGTYLLTVVDGRLVGIEALS